MFVDGELRKVEACSMQCVQVKVTSAPDSCQAAFRGKKGGGVQGKGDVELH